MPALTLIRHAEPELTGVLLGACDSPLSGAGREQAKRTLSGFEFKAVYASPLRRARETASALSPHANILDGLREISLGEWDGLSWAEVERRDHALAQAKLNDWLNVTPPQGESWIHFAARVENAFLQIRQGPFPAAVVAHITVNARLAQLAVGIDPATFQQAYCEVFTYDIQPDSHDDCSDQASR